MLLGFISPAAAQNLLTNGDFETGTVSGFSTALTVDNTTTLSYSTYRFTTDASSGGTGWTSPTSDHTPGAGTKMFLTRGANGNNTSTAVWSATATAVANNFYSFSGAAAFVTTLDTGTQKPTFKLVVTDVPASGTFTQTFNFTAPGTSWGAFLANFTYTGNKSTLTYTISIVNGSSGNNRQDALAWDDFYLTAPEPSTYAAGFALSGLVVWQWVRRRRRADTCPGAHGAP